MKMKAVQVCASRCIQGVISTQCMLPVAVACCHFWCLYHRYSGLGCPGSLSHRRAKARSQGGLGCPGGDGGVPQPSGVDRTLRTTSLSGSRLMTETHCERTGLSWELRQAKGSQGDLLSWGIASSHCW